MGRGTFSGRQGSVIIIGGAFVIAVGAAYGISSALTGGGSNKAGSAMPLISSSAAPGPSVSLSPVAENAAGGGACTIGESGEAVQVTVSGSSICTAFGQSLAQYVGGFWQLETPDMSLDLVCSMNLPGGPTATVMDSGDEILGRELCQDLQAAGDVENTASEGAIVQGQQSASAAAALASTEAATQQDAQGAVSTVSSDAQAFSADAQTIAQDAATADADLQTEKNDAAQGQGENCDNIGTVEADAGGTLAADEGGTLAADVHEASNDLQQLRSDINALQQDDQELSGYGMSAPAGASSAISSAQQSIGRVISSINSDIDHVTNDVSDGYKIANALATGSCSDGDGAGTPPTPPAHLS